MERPLDMRTRHYDVRVSQSRAGRMKRSVGSRNFKVTQGFPVTRFQTASSMPETHDH